MLQHLGAMQTARRIQDAIVKVLDMGEDHRTRDIGGTGSTADFTAAICDVLRKGVRADD